MSETDNIAQILLQELRLLLTPLIVATRPVPLGGLFTDVTGWNVTAGANAQLLQLVAAYQAFDALVEQPPRTVADVAVTVTRVSELIQLLDQGIATPDAASALGRNLIEALLIAYLANWHPLIYDTLVLVTAINPPATLSLDRLSALVKDPIAMLRAEYLGTNALATAADAQTTAERLFPRLAAFLSDLGFEARSGGAPPNGPLPSSVASTIAGPTLSVLLQPNFQEANRYAVTVGLSPRDLGDFGLIVVPSGTITTSWDTDVDLTPAAGGFAIGSQGVKLFGASAAFSTQMVAFDLSGVTIGSDEGIRLEIGSFKLSGLLGLGTEDHEYGVAVDFGHSKLVVAASNDDGFLASFLPPGGLSTTFDLAIGWTNKRGFYFQGSASLEVAIPVHETLGPVAIKQVTLSIEIDASGAVRTIAAISFDVTFGPIVVAVDQLGVRVNLDFGAATKNLGVVDLSAGLEPPKGAGLRIDSGPVSGGGTLVHDAARGRYAGAAILNALGRALSAFGVLDTKVPSGYSLLVAIQARIPPIPLGFGFNLLGVGGMVAAHRTVALDVIRTGLRDGGLATILYPDDPVSTFDQILAEIDRVFPSAQGRFIVAPTARIGWGTPTLLTADLALVVELPDPIKLALIGVVRCFLPDADSPLLKLQASFLGTVDFDKLQLAFDASLFDSKLLSFTLDGDMSARMQWAGLFPNMLVTVGGFHPAYTPPPMNLPALRRITIDLLGGTNPRLRADVYFARTSNSFQFGGHVELYAAVSKFNVYGFLGYDALVQILPTHFDVDVKATLAVRIGDDPIMTVDVELALSGPAPWHAKGKAHFDICWFLGFDVHFDNTWGKDTTLPAGEIDVLPLLTAALGDARNWNAALPDTVHALVTLRQHDDGFVEPAGTLTVSQKLVPLDLDIQLFSALVPRDATRFSIGRVTTQDPHTQVVTQLDTAPVAEEFAAAQFLEMSDADKLARPSFEHFHAGVVIANSDLLTADDVFSMPVEYEQIIIDDRAQQSRGAGRRQLDAAELDSLAAAGAVSRSSLARNSRFAPHSPTVTVNAETYTVVSSVDLTPALPGAALTYSEAVEHLGRFAMGGFHIVATSELST